MLSTQIVGASHDSPARTRQNPVRIRQFSARAAFGASSPSTHACAPACRQAAPNGTDAGEQRGGAGARGSVDRQHRRNSRRPAAQRRTSEKQQGFASPRLYQRRSTANVSRDGRQPAQPPRSPGRRIQGVRLCADAQPSTPFGPLTVRLPATRLESTARPVAPQAPRGPRARSTRSRAARVRVAPSRVVPSRVEHPAMAPRCPPASQRLRSSARRLAPATPEPP